MRFLRVHFLICKRAIFFALFVSLSLTALAYADEWNLKDKDGVRHKLSELKGKWVLVNFWAPWCPTCIQELPDLLALQQQHPDVQIIGIAVQYKNRKEVLDLVAKESITYPVVFGNEDTAGDFGGLVGMPTSFLYTPSGKLIGSHEGPLTRNEIEQVLAQKLGAAALFTR